MLGAGPSGQICPAFADQLERQTRPEAVDLRQVYAEHGVKRSAYIKGRSIRILCGLTRWRLSACGFRRRRVEPLQHRLDTNIARRYLVSAKIVEFQGLGQGEDVLFSIVADQGLLDRLN